MSPEKKSEVETCPSCGKMLAPPGEKCPSCGADVLLFMKRREERQRQRRNDIDKSNFLYFLAGIFFLIAAVPLYFVITGKWEVDYLWNCLGFSAMAAALAYFGYKVRREVKSEP